MKSITCILIVLWSFSLKSQTVMGWCQFTQVPDSLVYSLSEFNGSMVATGQFKNSGGQPARNIALFNGTNWSNLGNGLRGGINASAYETFVHNNQLYVVGNFDSCGTVTCNDIAVWNGTSWAAVGPVLPANTSTLFAGTVFNNEIIVAGVFNSFGGVTTNNVAKFNGSSWQTMGSGLNGSFVADLIEYQNKLYAVGSFSLNGTSTTYNLAVWDGSNWSSVGNGLVGPSLALEVYNNKLLIGGSATNNYEVLQFDGVNLTTHSTCTISPVRKFHQFNTRLILVGGLFGSSSQPYEYKPSTNTWEQLGYGVNMFTRGITDYNNELYIGGKFNTQGGSNFNYMAKACDVTGFNDLIENSPPTVSPNPAKDILNINSKDIQYEEISIYNLLGKVVYSDKIKSNSLQVSVSNWQGGIYFIYLKSDKSFSTLKFIKEN